MSTIVVGLGNPILTDDSVGIKVARSLRGRLPSDIDVTETYAGGLRLMDILTGYDRAVIIDALVTRDPHPGAIHDLTLEDSEGTRNLACTHDTSLAAALELGRSLGLVLPTNITIVGIEAQDVETFGEECTEAVAKAIPVAAERIVRFILKRSRS